MKTLSELRAQFPQYDNVSDGDFLIGINRKFYPNMHPRAFLNAISGAENAHATIRNDDLKSWYRERVQKPLDGETQEQTARRVGGSAEGPVGNPGGALEIAARGALQGITLGGGDEMTAAFGALSPDLTYDQVLKAERDKIALGRQDNPWAAYGGEVAGAVALPLGAVGPGKTVIGTAGKSAAAGAGLGAGYGFLAGEGGAENRAREALGSGILGGILGGALPLAGAGIKKLYDNSATRSAMRSAARGAPALDDLKAAASDIYSSAKGSILPRAAFATSADDMLTRARDFGLDADLMPGAATVASRIDDAAQSTNPGITFGELDLLRRKAAVPAGNIANRPEKAIGTGFIEGIDDFVSSVDPALGGQIGQAREMWSRLRKSELIDAAIEKAKNQASGFENGLRIEFRRILNSPKMARGFSDAERKAMKAVVDGTTFGNIMKKVGVMGLSAGKGGTGLGAAVSSGFGATIGSGIGGPVGGLIGGALPVAVGSVARKASEASTRGAADLARGLVAAGGVGAVDRMTPEARKAIEAAMRRGLLPFLPDMSKMLPLGANVN